MNLRDLTYLVAVAEQRHFGRAAESCHVSQPALSMQVKKLEDRLGVRLFERTNKSVMITEAGRRIVERARRVLQEVEDIREIAASFADPFSGKMLLGAFPTLAPYLLPKVVPALHAAYPALTLYLVEEKTEILVEKLRDGEVEAALLALPLEADFLECLPLFSEKFLLALPSGHPLASRRQATLEDIRHESLLLLEEGHCLRLQALEVCGLVGARENTEFRATSLETLRQMVAADVGMTLIPEFAVRAQDGIAYLPFADPSPARRIGLFYRKSTVRSELLAGIAAQIRDLIGAS